MYEDVRILLLLQLMYVKLIFEVFLNDFVAIKGQFHAMEMFKLGTPWREREIGLVTDCYYRTNVVRTWPHLWVVVPAFVEI